MGSGDPSRDSTLATVPSHANGSWQPHDTSSEKPESSTAEGDAQLGYVHPDPMDYQLCLDETSSLDPASLLRLFSYQSDAIIALEQLDLTTLTSDRADESQQRLIKRSHDDTFERSQMPGTETAIGQYVSLKDVEMNARYQFSNCSFDWFALENFEM